MVYKLVTTDTSQQPKLIFKVVARIDIDSVNWMCVKL